MFIVIFKLCVLRFANSRNEAVIGDMCINTSSDVLVHTSDAFDKTSASVELLVDGWRDGWRDGWMDGWRDGGMDGGIGRHKEVSM